MRIQNISSNCTFGMTATISKTTLSEVDKKILQDSHLDQKLKLANLKAINKALLYVTNNIDKLLDKIVKKNLEKTSKDLEYPKTLIDLAEKNKASHACDLIPNYKDSNIILGLEGNPYAVNRGMTVSVTLGDNIVDHYFGFGFDSPIKSKQLVKGFKLSLRELIKPFVEPKVKQLALDAKKLEPEKVDEEFAGALNDLKHASDTGHF